MGDAEPLSSSSRPAGGDRKAREGGGESHRGPLNDSLLSEAPYAGSCLPIGSFFSGCWLRKLAQFSSPAPQLVSTPHLTWQRPLLCGAWREGRGDPGVVAHESEADPSCGDARCRAGASARPGPTESRGSQTAVLHLPLPLVPLRPPSRDIYLQKGLIPARSEASSLNKQAFGNHSHRQSKHNFTRVSRGATIGSMKFPLPTFWL